MTIGFVWDEIKYEAVLNLNYSQISTAEILSRKELKR